jgi:hypothetical protein
MGYLGRTRIAESYYYKDCLEAIRDYIDYIKNNK